MGAAARATSDAPGVETQGQVGVCGSGPFEERQHPVDLLRGRYRLALLAGADATDVDDVGALVDRLVQGAHRRVEVGVPVAREERVVGAVDDGHDRGVTRVEDASPQHEGSRLDESQIGYRVAHPAMLSPGSGASWKGLGIASSSRRVYSSSGCRITRSDGPASTTCPSLRTMTSSESIRALSRSWVM